MDAVSQQALGLMPRADLAARPPVVAVTSGKGGVGKTSLVANLGAILAARGQRVLLIDADYGLANLGVVFGVTAKRTLEDALEGRASLAETILSPLPNLALLPAGNGIRRLAALSATATGALLAGATELTRAYDLVLVDTAAGIAPAVLATLAWADEVVVVTGDDPASFVDSYAVLKLVLEEDAAKPVALIVNRVQRRADGERIQRNLAVVAERFLGRSPEALGVVPQDTQLAAAVRAQRLVAVDAPGSAAVKALTSLAPRLGRLQRPCPALAG